MSPTQPVTTEECHVLGALVAPDLAPPERTTAALAEQLDMDPHHLAGRLKELEGRSPPLVVLVADEAWAVQAWEVTAEGRETFAERCA
jgi:hypothetical protein